MWSHGCFPLSNSGLWQWAHMIWLPALLAGERIPCGKTNVQELRHVRWRGQRSRLMTHLQVWKSITNCICRHWQCQLGRRWDICNLNLKFSHQNLTETNNELRSIQILKVIENNSQWADCLMSHSFLKTRFDGYLWLGSLAGKCRIDPAATCFQSRQV